MRVRFVGVPLAVRTVEFADMSDPFVLRVGRRAWVVERATERWRTVAYVTGEGDTEVVAWKPRFPQRPRQGGARGRGDLPRISYERLSPSEVRVRVSDARSPFLLALTETRTRGWQLEAAGQEAGSLRHVTVNGYANGWIVPWRGTYDTKLVYEPERAAELARSTGMVIAPLLLVAWLSSILLGGRLSSDTFLRRRRRTRRVRG